MILVEVKTALDIAKEGIESLDKGLDLYHKILDKVVPWSKLNKTMGKLGNNRFNYSEEAAALIGQIEPKMMDGMDAYFRATQNMFQWCGLAIDLLEPYKTLFDGEMDQDIYNTQREILLQLLDDGITRMKKGQGELAVSSSSFNVAAGKLTELNRRLAKDFDENSKYVNSQMATIPLLAYGAAAPITLPVLSLAAGFVEELLVPELKKTMKLTKKFYQNFSVDVKKAVKSINGIRAKLEEEIKHIGESQLQNQNTKINVELNVTTESKKALLQSIDHLITKCNDYRARHINAN